MDSGDDKLHRLIKALDKESSINLQELSCFTAVQQDAVGLKLLALHHNYSIKPEETMISVLGQALKIISCFVKLPQLAIHLARFNYNGFLDVCQARKKDDMERRSKGIYPSMLTKVSERPLYIPYRDTLPQNSTIGNRNWEYSRKVLQTWFQTSRESLTVEEQVAYLVLLADRRQLEVKCSNDTWTRIWNQLYCYYVHETLNPYRTMDPPYPLFSFEQVLQQVRLFTQDSTVETEKGMQLLFLSLLQPQIETKRRQFMSSYNYLGNRYDSLRRLIESCIYYKVGVHYELTEITNSCRKGFEKHLRSPANKHEYYDYFMRVFMDEGEIKEELKALRRMPNYPDLQTNRQLVESISLEIMLAEPDNIISVLDYLPVDEFVNSSLRMKQWLNSLLFPQLLSHFEQREKRYVQILAEQTSGNPKTVLKDYQKYLEIWALYHEIMANNLKNLVKLRQFIRLSEHEFCTQMRLIIATPFQYAKCNYEILHAYSTALVDSLRRIENVAQQIQPNAAKENIVHNAPHYKQIIHEKAFEEMMCTLNKEERDEIWVIWFEVFIRDEELMKEIIEQGDQHILEGLE